MNMRDLGGPLVVLILLFLLFIPNSATIRDCTTVTDLQLVESILDEMKNDSLLSPQASHIIVGSVNRFVKLQGWTDNKRGYDRMVDIVSNTRCVIAINVNKFSETPPAADDPQRPLPSGGCAAGMKQCGDVCIPEADSCVMRLTKATD
jgi:hypothetical protein